jgi:hypothetical protein
MSNNKRQLNWQVQHIFARELASADRAGADEARSMLASAGFNLESIGNKMGLLVSPQMRDSIKSAPAAIQDAFSRAGFGLNTQNGSHPSKPVT